MVISDRSRSRMFMTAACEHLLALFSFNFFRLIVCHVHHVTSMDVLLARCFPTQHHNHHSKTFNSIIISTIQTHHPGLDQRLTGSASWRDCGSWSLQWGFSTANSCEANIMQCFFFLADFQQYVCFIVPVYLPSNCFIMRLCTVHT